MRGEIQAFSDSVGELAGTVVGNVRELSKFSHRTRRIAIGLVLSLVLDLGVTAWLWVTNQRLSQVQTTTNNNVLCPLYGLIVSGYHPEARTAGAARDEYIADYKIIRSAYTLLHCTPSATAPASTTPTTPVVPSPAHS
jgi:hypothetical protein